MAAYFGNFEFDVSKIEFDLTISRRNQKPLTAFWTSTAVREEDFGYLTSAWVWFYISEFLDGVIIRPVKYIFEPKKGLKVYEIDTKDDFYAEELAKDKDGNIDYIAMAQAGWDGIHFTANGALLGKYGSNCHIDALFNIDVESTVWFRPDWFQSIEEDFSWDDYTVPHARFATWEDYYPDWEERYSEDVAIEEQYDESDCDRVLL